MTTKEQRYHERKLQHETREGDWEKDEGTAPTAPSFRASKEDSDASEGQALKKTTTAGIFEVPGYVWLRRAGIEPEERAALAAWVVASAVERTAHERMLADVREYYAKASTCAPEEMMVSCLAWCLAQEHLRECLADAGRVASR